MSTTKPKVSVVIILKNSEEVRLTLSALAIQLDHNETECIVVDASQPQSSLLRNDFAWVTWLTFEGSGKKFTIAEQRNEGISHARGEIVVFIDAGCVPDANWLESLIAPIRAGEFDAACGPIRSARPGVYTIINSEGQGEKSGQVPTGNLAFRRDLAATIGQFDTRFDYGSDTDWTLRAQELGFRFAVSDGAGVTLDFGRSGESVRRSFRYGRGRTRMLAFNPHRIRGHLLWRPDFWIYPIFILGLVFLPFISFSFTAGLLYVLLLTIPLLKNYREPRPHLVVFDHLIQGAATLFEIGVQIFRTRAEVVHFPDDRVYVQPLIREHNSMGLRSSAFTPIIGNQALTLALFPITIGWQRLRGLKIFVLHWTWGFGVGKSAPRKTRRIARWWFYFNIVWIRILGIKIVWTAHNLLPHSPVFDNDVVARKFLVRWANRIIAHHEITAEELRNNFGARRVDVVPQGMSTLSLPNRELSRQNLDVPVKSSCIIFIGRIEPYKGVPTLIKAVREVSLKRAVSLRIGGQSTVKMQNEITGELTESDFNCQIRFDSLSEKELLIHLSAADLVVLPFTEITNSGSALTAIAAGRRLIIPAHASLGDLTPNSVTRYWPPEDPHHLATAINEALDDEDALRKENQSLRFAEKRSWKFVAEKYAAVLVEVLN